MFPASPLLSPSLGSFGVPFCKKKHVSSGGRDRVGCVGPWEGLTVPCTGLQPLHPSLPLTLSESLLLWHLILPVHGCFWGSAGELACLSWCPLEGMWVFAASVLPSRLPTLHLPSISLECVDTLDPLLSPFPFALSLWVYTRDHPSTVIRSETRCSVLHVKGPCPLRVVLAGHCPALLPGTCSPVFSSSLLFLGSLSVLLALSLSCFFLFLSFLVCRKKCLTMQF